MKKPLHRISACIFIISALLLNYTTGHAQMLKKLDTGIDYAPRLSCTDSQNFYILYLKSISGFSETYELAKWNGTFWATIPTFTISGFQKYIHSMAVYNGEIYVGGRYDSAHGVTTQPLMKFSGSNWQAVGGGGIQKKDSNTVEAMHVYNNQLFVTGNFDSAGSVAATRIAKFDGNNWNYVGTSSNSQGLEFPHVRFFTYKNNLLLYGYYVDTVGHTGTQFTFLGWNDTVWLPQFASPHSIYKPTVFTYNDSLYYLLEKSVHKFTGTGWQAVNQGLNSFYNFFPDAAQSHKGKVYTTGYFVKGSDYAYNAVYDGQSWELLPMHTPGERRLYSNGNNLYMTGQFVLTNSIDTIIRYAAEMITEFGKISGKIYTDKNNNCEYNLGSDSLLKHELIEFTPGPYYLNSFNGVYSGIIPSGNYKVKLMPKKYWTADCPQNGYSINIKTDSLYPNRNFGTVPIPNVTDLRVTLTASLGWRTRQGFEESYQLCYENVGTKTIANGKVELKYGTSQDNFSATPTATGNASEYAYWNFSNLKMGEKRCISVKLRNSLSTTLGDTIKMYVRADSLLTSTDSFLVDNFDTLKMNVVAAFDPNDKQSFPAGNITAETRELRYLIRFQNTGTDTAYKVEVIDTIDTNLPLTKITMNSSSHPYRLTIENNVLRWTFNNILLPDSNINEPLSHGYISYSAQIKPGLAVGTEIENTAYIYFDYQKPIITNTVFSKLIEDEVGIKQQKLSLNSYITVYPNPANEVIYIKNESFEKQQLQLINMLGQTIQQIQLQPNENLQINTAQLPNGLYFIRGKNAEAKKLLIRH